MSKYHLYGVAAGRAWHLATNSAYSSRRQHWQPRLVQYSDYVWQQGPRGGVKLVYQCWTLGEKFKKHGYVTNDIEAMKEFMWVKLTAQDVKE